MYNPKHEAVAMAKAMSRQICSKQGSPAFCYEQSYLTGLRSALQQIAFKACTSSDTSQQLTAQHSCAVDRV